jgi:hypothetical protein
MRIIGGKEFFQTNDKEQEVQGTNSKHEGWHSKQHPRIYCAEFHSLAVCSNIFP